MTRIGTTLESFLFALLLGLSALILFDVGIAAAQGLPPRCGPEHRGVEACMANDTCTCDWYPGGSITAKPAGWRWQCDIERMCGEGPAADGTGGGAGGGLPPGSVVAPQIELPSGNPLMQRETPFLSR